MSWTVSLLLLTLWHLGEPSAFDDELGLIGRGGGSMTEVLVANAALKVRLFTWMAWVDEAMGDEKAAAKARDAASEALELALTDRDFARHFLGDARDLLAHSRRGPASHGRPPAGVEAGVDTELDLDRGGSVDDLEQQRSELRAARERR
jgi:hypothetical protein